ncbi:hypothetical protein [Halobacillus litoralis]|uniref:hypothetical protein n=1 Tax=Halobacillus litoralis TaxID=45668 RepID=UPI001CFE3907|nr:hypothetical protein [Halobacillus litoralis]
MRNFLAVLVVWNLSFLMMLPRFTTSPGDTYFQFSMEDIHGVYIGLFLLLLLVLFPLSLVINRMVERMEIGRFFIKVGLYLPACAAVWMILNPYFTFGYEMIVMVVLFAITHELLFKFSQGTVKKMVKGGLLSSFIIALGLYFGFSF